MDSPRLVYLANARVPSERAHVLQIFKNCEAFAKHGLVVELLHPRREPTEAMKGVTDPYDYYQVERCFELREVPVYDSLLRAPSWAQAVVFTIQSLTFALRASRYSADREGTLYYTRDFYVATVLAAKRCPYLFELHTMPRRGPIRAWTRFVAERALGVIAITRELADEWRAAGAPPEKILVAADAVDERRLVSMPAREAARAALGVGAEERVAVYAGHFYTWKGMPTLVDCARLLPDVTFILVGGTDDDVKKWNARVGARIRNLRLIPHVPPARVPQYLAVADVLLLPNSGKIPLSSRHTSPLKAFEYMAAERPVVASDLPSLRELFRHETTALLVPPDDPVRLADAIRRLLSDVTLSERLAANARNEVVSRTWTARARLILEFARVRGAAIPEGAGAAAYGARS